MSVRPSLMQRWALGAAVLAVGAMCTRCEPLEYPHSAVYADSDPDALVRLDRALRLESDPWFGPAATSADLDGDGHDDLVWRIDDRLWFAFGPPFLEGGRLDQRVDAWALSDIDNDGTPDLITAKSGNVHWSSYDPETQDWTRKASFRVYADLHSMVVGDVDADGLREVIGSCESDCNAIVIETTAEQGFDAFAAFPGSGDDWPQIADVDADGADDVVSRHKVIFGDVDGQYETVLTNLVDTVHDVDGDGDLDLLDFRSRSVYHNLDGRSFGEPDPFSVGDSGDFLLRADIIDDPEPEILLLDRPELWRERILLVARSADGDGLEVRRTFDEGTHVDAVVPGDFDGNGSVDLLYSWSDGDDWDSGCGG